MGKLLMIILPVIGLLGGLAGGVLLAPEEKATATDGEKAAAHEEAEAAHAGAAGEEISAKERPPDHAAAEGETEYARLSKQFVVPVIAEGKVASMMVLDLAIEVGVGDTAIIAEKEPKLRDEFLTVLFRHAQSGGFSGDFTRPQVMDDLRASLDEAARRVVGKAARKVLVTGILRQDF